MRRTHGYTLSRSPNFLDKILILFCIHFTLLLPAVRGLEKEKEKEKEREKEKEKEREREREREREEVMYRYLYLAQWANKRSYIRIQNKERDKV